MQKIKGCNLPYGTMILQFKHDGTLRDKVTLEDECKILGQFSVRHLGFVKGFDVVEYRARANSLSELLDTYFSAGISDCLVSFKRTGKNTFCGPSAPTQRRKTASLRSAICLRVQHTA